MNPPAKRYNTALPWTRWWWMGNAITEQEITRHLELYKAAGIGGVEITPIYGVKGRESGSLPMLSPEWIKVIRHAISEGARIGIGVDMTLGSGWPYGGSHLRDEDAPQKIEIIEENGKFRLQILPTGQQVKRPAPGGEGHVMCPYSTAAFERFIEPYGKIFSNDAVPPRAFFYDSFEVFGASFATGFLESFKTVKSYDLADHLPALAGKDDPEKVARIRCDYRDVMFERLLEEGIKPWVAWAHVHGINTRYQAHGAPGNLIDLYAASDIPETEVFGTNQFPWIEIGRHPEIVDASYPIVTKLASSAAHLTGKPLVSSETFTWHREHFSGSFAEMKPELDQLFLSGINHLFFHGSTYSPANASWPGWLFYASTHFDPAQPLWRELPAFSNYIAFCQEILQTGKIECDLAFYFPFHDIISRPGEQLQMQLSVHGIKDFISGMEWGRIATEFWQKNIEFDFFSDRLAASVKHRVTFVPPCRFMPLATLKKLVELGRNGARLIVIGDGPESAPGMSCLSSRSEYDAARTDLLALAIQVQQDGLINALKSLGIGQSLSGAPEGIRGIKVIRDGDELHFIANHSESDFEGWIGLRKTIPSGSLKLVDPVRNQTGIATTKNGQVFLQLVPGESVWIMPANGEEQPWLYTNSSDQVRKISAPWKLEAIEGGPKLPAPVTMDELRSWTELSTEWRDFSGTVRYSTGFDWDEPANAPWVLTFPKVSEMVRVKLNGTDLGTLWCPPMELDVTHLLRPGRNELICEVTNLAINRIAGMDRRNEPWRIFHDINFATLHYQSFDASGNEPRESGLIEEPLLKKVKPLGID